MLDARLPSLAGHHGERQNCCPVARSRPARGSLHSSPRAPTSTDRAHGNVRRLNDQSFCLGQEWAQSTSAAGTTTAPVRTTAYGYDLADRLTGITPQAGAGAAATLTLDALGRHRTRVAGGITETYTYAGESSAIVRISPSTGTTTSSVVDATGARLAVSTSSGGFGWTLSDLRGDIAGYAAATGAVVTDAARYDPYGEVLAATSSGLGSPWGYQGRLDLAP